MDALGESTEIYGVRFPDLDLTEQDVLEIMDYTNRKKDWLIAYLPAHCGRFCDDLLHEWRVLARKLLPLEFLRVGLLQCTDTPGFCNNVQTPTARLYPADFNQHYTVSLLHLSQAPYIWEWALEYVDESVDKINWQIYSKKVISEELNPTSENKPLLIYFHSPKCFSCYEQYADFFIAGYILDKVVQLAKVNCIEDRLVCQHAQIEDYPTLKLFLNRHWQQTYSSPISIDLCSYEHIVEEIRHHLKSNEEEDQEEVKSQGFAIPVDIGVKHEEL